MYKGDIVSIGINHKQTVARPEVYIAIYKYKAMNLNSGVYNPDDMELLYEQEAEANAFGFNGCIGNF